jgi:hypothetical protein
MARAGDTAGAEVSSPAITGGVSNNAFAGEPAIPVSQPLRRGEAAPLRARPNDPTAV